MKGWTVLFPLPECPPGTSINSVEWKYHTINGTILLAKINLNEEQKSKIFSKRTGIQIMENGTLHIEDVKDEDSGNYSCTIISHDQRMHIERIYLQVLDVENLTTEPNSIKYATTFKPSEPSVIETTLITIPVCSALGIILIVATVLIFKCRKKCRHTSDEPIYVNKVVTIQGNKRSQVGRRMPDNKNR
ncbi:Tyrosine-protein kinase-like otk [Labeo rohita]|uniref:Tyrosine-protein kinase-like otk n=2 Tax=Labeo rohita TaxID=84645 RepID=A0ABQ8L659_LABRO|nr:Tyrosine-protein kinase-like otk [Labeo rohita]